MPKSWAVIDANRLTGPVQFDDLPVDPRPEMDRLGIDAACVTHALSLYSDPRAGNEALRELDDPRLIPVPVVVPGEVEEPGAGMVRLCPRTHGFSLSGPIASRWLADQERTVAVELDETTPAELLALALRSPRLRILLLNPGYRRLRAVAELMAEAPNVWLEIGTVNTQRGVEWLASRFGARRLVFGTGAPVLDDCGPRFLLDHLELDQDELARVAAGTLKDLL